MKPEKIRNRRRNQNEAAGKQKTIPQSRKKVKKEKTAAKKGKGKSKNAMLEYFPIEKIENGIIYTTDKRYLKIIEVEPINFLLRSAREQRNIIYSFVSYLKISPVKLQFKVITKKADINKHLARVQQEIEREKDRKSVV